MYYKAGERESPESWTGNWRIESLKVDGVQNKKYFHIITEGS